MNRSRSSHLPPWATTKLFILRKEGPFELVRPIQRAFWWKTEHYSCKWLPQSIPTSSRQLRSSAKKVSGWFPDSLRTETAFSGKGCSVCGYARTTDGNVLLWTTNWKQTNRTNYFTPDTKVFIYWLRKPNVVQRFREITCSGLRWLRESRESRLFSAVCHADWLQLYQFEDQRRPQQMWQALAPSDRLSEEKLHNSRNKKLRQGEVRRSRECILHKLNKKIWRVNANRDEPGWVWEFLGKAHQVCPGIQQSRHPPAESQSQLHPSWSRSAPSWTNDCRATRLPVRRAGMRDSWLPRRLRGSQSVPLPPGKEQSPEAGWPGQGKK